MVVERFYFRRILSALLLVLFLATNFNSEVSAQGGNNPNPMAGWPDCCGMVRGLEEKAYGAATAAISAAIAALPAAMEAICTALKATPEVGAALYAACEIEKNGISSLTPPQPGLQSVVIGLLKGALMDVQQAQVEIDGLPPFPPFYKGSQHDYFDQFRTAAAQVPGGGLGAVGAQGPFPIGKANMILLTFNAQSQGNKAKKDAAAAIAAVGAAQGRLATSKFFSPWRPHWCPSLLPVRIMRQK